VKISWIKISIYSLRTNVDIGYVSRMWPFHAHIQVQMIFSIHIIYLIIRSDQQPTGHEPDRCRHAAGIWEVLQKLQKKVFLDSNSLSLDAELTSCSSYSCQSYTYQSRSK
jgi:hypothetical protein